MSDPNELVFCGEGHTYLLRTNPSGICKFCFPTASVPIPGKDRCPACLGTGLAKPK